MINPQTPDLDKELAKRIQLVRRDMSNLLFHFTRASGEYNAATILKNILRSEKLLGNGKWTEGVDCVCFTEAPISEFTAIFSLIEIASKQEHRPRYEPYGIAVTKKWLFSKGGRPVIYEKHSEFQNYDKKQEYRLVPFDPEEKIDFTWEREWRIKTNELKLDKNEAMVVVPTAKEAFDIMDGSVPEPSGYGTTASWAEQQRWHMPSWMVVSLDIFGVQFNI